MYIYLTTEQFSSVQFSSENFIYSIQFTAPSSTKLEKKTKKTKQTKKKAHNTYNNHSLDIQLLHSTLSFH